MNDTQKMLRTIINHVSVTKSQLLGEISGLKKDLGKRIDNLEKKVDKLDGKVDKGFKDVNHRIDLLGEQLAELDDDAPTGDEFKVLEKKVENLEQQFA